MTVIPANFVNGVGQIGNRSRAVVVYNLVSLVIEARTGTVDILILGITAVEYVLNLELNVFSRIL